MPEYRRSAFRPLCPLCHFRIDRSKSLICARITPQLRASVSSVPRFAPCWQSRTKAKISIPGAAVDPAASYGAASLKRSIMRWLNRRLGWAIPRHEPQQSLGHAADMRHPSPRRRFHMDRFRYGDADKVMSSVMLSAHLEHQTHHPMTNPIQNPRRRQNRSIR